MFLNLCLYKFVLWWRHTRGGIFKLHIGLHCVKNCVGVSYVYRHSVLWTKHMLICLQCQWTRRGGWIPLSQTGRKLRPLPPCRRPWDSCVLNGLCFVFAKVVFYAINPLTPTGAIWVLYWVKPSFVIFDILALTRSALSPVQPMWQQ